MKRTERREPIVRTETMSPTATPLRERLGVKEVAETLLVLSLCLGVGLVTEIYRGALQAGQQTALLSDLTVLYVVILLLLLENISSKMFHQEQLDALLGPETSN